MMREQLDDGERRVTVQQINPNPEHGPPAHRPNQRVECADGFSMSVQASSYNYSHPRRDLAPSYSQVEVGMPNSPDDLTNTVYPYVPRQVIVDVICKHGGIISGQLPAGIPYLRYND
jgi:hypothetical protein